MRVFSRRDLFLVLGLLVALVVIFARPVHRMLEVAREVELDYQLALIPGLLILAVTLLVHELVKRQEVHATAAASAAEARQATERVRELERLVTFGQALGHALDLDSLREALWRHLPSVTGGRRAWVVVPIDGRWERLAGDAAAREGEPSPEELAARVLREPDEAEPDRRHYDGYYCFPLRFGDAAVGVLGVEQSASPLTLSEWQILAAAAALLASSIRTVQLFREIREHSLHDALTGCFNRAHALEVLDIELRRANRTHLPLSIVMFDLDVFKQINDRHGHLCGDAVLAALGRRLKELLRNSDVKCRYGGEEFLIVLPDTPAAGAVHVAEWLRREIADLTVPCNGASLSTTASFGVASAVPGEREATALIARADAALYHAKREGRNCVRLEEGSAPVADPGARQFDARARADE